MPSIAEQWAQYAVSLKFEDLPGEVVHQARRLYLDTLACAYGGYDSEAVRILHDVAARDLRGPEEATIIGTGTKTTALNAILLNGAMVRFLDANDISPGGHNSEVIPGALAVGQRQGASGKEVLLSSIIGYELAGRFHMAIQGSGPAAGGGKLEALGWNGDMRAGFIMPPVFGRLLGLDAEQIANAVGISGARSFLLGIMDAAEEQNTLAKNIRFPLTAHMALTSTYLAGRGMTGPKRVFEGHMGFQQSFFHGELDLERLITPGDGWMIMRAGTKAFSACYATHGHLRATVDLAKEIDLKPEQVEAIKIVTNPRTKWHTGNPDTRRRVNNKETADHSSYYVTAIGIIEGEVGPEQYTTDRYEDPKVHNLMDRITIEAEDRYTAVYPGSRVEILTKDGKLHTKEVEHPRGHYLNPMEDSEIEAKFHQMARRYMDEGQRQEIISAVYEIDRLDNVGKLMELLRFRK